MIVIKDQDGQFTILQLELDELIAIKFAAEMLSDPWSKPKLAPLIEKINDRLHGVDGS